jgi:hypothetical protein
MAHFCQLDENNIVTQVIVVDNKEIAEQIIEMERKQGILINILKEVATKYPEIREEIMRKLSEVQTEVIVIDN